MSDINELPPTSISFIIDGQIVETMRVHDKLAAILLSEPKIVDTTNLFLQPGDLYNEETGKFTRPAQELN